MGRLDDRRLETIQQGVKIWRTLATEHSGVFNPNLAESLQEPLWIACHRVEVVEEDIPKLSSKQLR